MRRRLLALLAPLVFTCGADWTGTYEGAQGSQSYRLVVTQTGTALRADTFLVRLGAQAPCELHARRCDATLAADGRGFAADACLVTLRGHADGCTGELDFMLRASEVATGHGFVSAVVVESSLDDVPVPLQRVPTQCSDGADNDADGRIDHPADPQCADAHGLLEAAGAGASCGLGVELALLLPWLAWARRRRLRDHPRRA